MSKLEKIFLEFVKANDLKVRGDFQRHTRVYSGGFISSDKTYDELRATEEFAGFSDGIQGNNNRYHGAHGSARPQRVMETLDRFFSTVPGMNEALEQASSGTMLAYKRQYRIGSSLRGVVHI